MDTGITIGGLLVGLGILVGGGMFAFGLLGVVAAQFSSASDDGTAKRGCLTSLAGLAIVGFAFWSLAA